ncbi:MAG: hypothetical protein EOO88_26540 [Pedobacter sp.]|nr:MAG: hypothetical protein EOO88_26540 [Pedobacter sp.]
MFIDKITVTVPLPRSDWEVACENLFHVRHLSKNMMPVRNEKGYYLYNYAWVVEVQGLNGGKVRCLIQAWPKFGKTHFLRIEWTPSKAGPRAVYEIGRLMARCIPCFYDHWQLARLTRADITFDVFRVSINQVLLFSDSARTSTKRYINEEGHVTGIYIGAGSSNRRLVVYNKLLEQKKLEVSVVRDEGGKITKRVYRSKTRFEFRLRDIGLVRESAEFANQLNKYFVVLLYKARAYSANDSWQQFLKRSERDGAQGALSLIADRKRRQAYKTVLKVKCTPDWFDHRQLWLEAKREIARLVPTHLT